MLCVPTANEPCDWDASSVCMNDGWCAVVVSRGEQVHLESALNFLTEGGFFFHSVASHPAPPVAYSYLTPAHAVVNWDNFEMHVHKRVIDLVSSPDVVKQIPIERLR